MRLRQLGWRACYELLASRVRRPEWSFMNYGFAAAPDSPRAAVDLRPEDEPDRLCIQLYEHVVTDAVLEGRDVLEVGCGRGGGSSYLSRYHHPRSTTGLDFSAAAVALCRRDRRGPGLSFVRGDAQRMPFPDDAFDVVVNVESSHCYDSVPAFLAEVRRVLRPGGVFLYADFRPTAEVPALRDQLHASGLTLVHDEDITPNVVSALRADDARKAALIDAWLPRVARPFTRRFAALEGTQGFSAFAAGRTTYLSARLVKPT